MAKLFGPDGIVEIPDEALEEMSRAHAEAEDDMKTAKLEEANDWLFSE
jgi:hypothetical protein